MAMTANTTLLPAHRNWEDWLSALVGLGVILLPVFVGASGGTVAQTTGGEAVFTPIFGGVSPGLAAMTATGLAGILIAGVALLELVSLQRWEEVIELLLGAVVIAVPFMFGYGGALAYWQMAFGAVVMVLAVIELWQDRNRKLDA